VSDIVDAEEVGEINVKGIHNPVMTYNIKVNGGQVGCRNF